MGQEDNEQKIFKTSTQAATIHMEKTTKGLLLPVVHPSTTRLENESLRIASIPTKGYIKTLASSSYFDLYFSSFPSMG